MLQRTKCLFGNHNRDSHRVKFLPDGNERSYCSGCGRAMVKEYKGVAGVWRLDK